MSRAADPRSTPRRSLAALIRRLLGDERVRFLLVGGFNTLFGYLLFIIFELSLGDLVGGWVGDLVSLFASYAIATVVAFVLHRHFTYRVTGSGNVLVDYLRFVSVYLVSLAINAVVLPLLVEFAHLEAILAQGLIVVITTLVSYFGHKFFSFRRKPSVVVDEAGASLEGEPGTADTAH
jgi:putative flippase GtrA